MLQYFTFTDYNRICSQLYKIFLTAIYHVFSSISFKIRLLQRSLSLVLFNWCLKQLSELHTKRPCVQVFVVLFLYHTYLLNSEHFHFVVIMPFAPHHSHTFMSKTTIWYEKEGISSTRTMSTSEVESYKIYTIVDKIIMLENKGVVVTNIVVIRCHARDESNDESYQLLSIVISINNTQLKSP